MLGTEYVWKKNPFMGKFAEDIGRVWEYYITYVNVIPE